MPKYLALSNISHQDECKYIYLIHMNLHTYKCYYPYLPGTFCPVEHTCLPQDRAFTENKRQ